MGMRIQPGVIGCAIQPVIASREFCTGMIRIAEAANQIRGRAGLHQMANVRSGLAHAGSGFAMQYQSAIVLGKEARA